MATAEQVELLLEQLEKSHPSKFFKRMNETQAGIGAVLRLLSESKNTVTAGDISNFLDVSTARVAVVLKKMVAKGLIIKESDPLDARITVVKLTAYGEENVQRMKEELYEQIATVIDKVGEERLYEFVAISNEIRDALKGPRFDF